ncbi:MAG: Starch-binding associating with outer rane [Mucilaginibacter sp.]|nr:Starch-binding associating with outer rane [Mucilaginibacter sp.]
MKKILKIYLLPVLMVLTVSSCKKTFEDRAINHNVPTSVPASLLLNGVLNSMVDFPDGSSEIYDQYYIYNYNYYGDNTYDLGSGDNYYLTLKNVLLMEQQAVVAGSPAVNPYSAIGKFFRAYFFSKMSLEEGDIPMTQALQGLANLKPVYDSQKAVMVQSLAWLESANADLASLITTGSNTLTGDIFFGGDLTKWQKVVNAYRIRLLTELSKKTSETDLNVPAQFAAIIANPAKYPLMASSDDNLQYTFVAPTNYYPQNPDNFGQNGSRQNSSQTYIKLLTSFKDPRVYVTAEPARYLVDTKKQSPTDFASFVGADPGLDLGVMYNNAGLQFYSFINRKRYYSTYTGEPSIQIGYPELMFNIAEGINRGWAPGNAETYYTAGIQASMAYYGIPVTGSFTAYFYRPGSSSTTNIANYDTYAINTNWNTYYTQSAVKYAGGATGLTQILQ